MSLGVAAPVDTGERMATLDALRGVAVLGILVINVDAMSGYAFTPRATHVTQALAPWDGITWAVLATLVEAKFYSVFSFLFGVGFAVFVQRAAAKGHHPARLFKRRLVGLMLIGLVHALLIWHGDILFTYGLLGFALLPFLKRDDRTVLRWGIGLLLAPIVLYMVMFAAYAALAPPPDPAAATPAAEGLPPFLLAAVERLAHGGYTDLVRGNAAFFTANFVRRLLLMFYPRVLGMFLLGFWAGRRRLFADVGAHAPLFSAVGRVGLAVGLPLCAFAAWWGESSVGPPNPAAVVETVVRSVGVPLLALGYVATLARLFARTPALTRAIAPVGRMALTSYLTHSVASVVVFSALGFGLFGRVSLTTAVLGSLVLFALQVVASRAWLSVAQFGPAEWVWRDLTYGRVFPLLKRAT